jgi:hypothetical protein
VNVRFAGAAFAAALALVLFTGWHAFRTVEVQPVPSAANGSSDSAGPQSPGQAYSLTRVLTALDKDPFHPQRRRPARRPQSGGENAVPNSPAQGGSVLVIGTAVSADGRGFAMCAWGGAPPRIVRVGERVGDWTLRAVSKGAAEFTSPTGVTTVVRIVKPGEKS